MTICYLTTERGSFGLNDVVFSPLIYKYKPVGGGKKLLLLRTLAVRHTGAGRPSVRSGKRMIAKGKKKRTVLVMAVVGGRIDVLRTH